MTLTAEEVAMFYAIYTDAEPVDWACYDAFRLRILAAGAEQTASPHALASPSHGQGRPSGLPRVPALGEVLDCADPRGG